MTDITQEFTKAFPQARTHEPLKPYTTFKIGGPADFFCIAKNTETIQKLIKFSKKHGLPYLVIGAASNILFDDQGFRGLVVKIECQNLEVKNTQITAEAGVLIPRLIEESIKNNLSGLEKWVGLPGTVGGAVRGNAGCNGLETADILTVATILDPEKGETSQVERDYFEYNYRESSLKKSNQIVLSATFQLQKSELPPEKQQEIMDKLRKFRQDKQPIGFTTGSFFKNPSPSQPAGFLLEQAGLKGKQVGNAQISEKHANFFINKGNATSQEMLTLAKTAKQLVKAKFGLNLQEEVQIISSSGKAQLL